MSTNNDKGYLGEQTMGFVLGNQGYYLIDGPGGAAGHSINASGFDGVAYNPRTKHLVIYDNKSMTRAGNICSATAIDPARSLANNLSTLIPRIKSMILPNKADILNLLEQTKSALQNGSGWPPNVQIAVTNANGNSSGVTEKLARKGISFIRI